MDTIWKIYLALVLSAVTISVDCENEVPPLFKGMVDKAPGFNRSNPSILKIELKPLFVEKPVKRKEIPGLGPRKDSKKRLVTRYQQTWQSFDIYGFGVTKQQGKKEKSLVSRLINVKKLVKDLKSTFPNLTAKQAIKFAMKNRLKGKIYRVVKPKKDSRAAQLIVYLDPRDNMAKWVYRVEFAIATVNGTDAITNVNTLVDADTGEIIKSETRLLTYSMAGDGGNIHLGRYRYGSRKLAGKKIEVDRSDDLNNCAMLNPRVSVYDGRQMNIKWQIFDCFQAEPYQEVCDPKTPNGDSTNFSYSQVHDAMYLATRFLDMLKEFYDDETIPTMCGQLKICTHLEIVSAAFFRDAGSCETFFGLHGSKYFDWVCPSILAHELAHAFIAHTAKLDTVWRIPTAINEAFADMAGLVFKTYMNGYKNDWKVGDEIKLDREVSEALRHLDDPPRDEESIDCFKDYKGQDAHYVAGVYNKAFYNLATTPFWNIRKTFEVFLRAAKYYWQRDTDFDQGACGVIQAADDQGYRTNDVRAAFAKVGVFCACPTGWIARKEVRVHSIEPGNSSTSCYRFTEDLSTWADAYVFCESVNAHLVILEDEDKEAWINFNIQRPGQFWVGGADIEVDGEWRWAPTGNKMKWTNWGPGQPSTGNQANKCLSIMTDVDGSVLWRNRDCSEKLAFICEMSCCGKACRRG